MISLGGNGCVCCEPPPGVELPAIEVLASGDLFVLLCLWGFPMDEEVIVELYDPTGEAVASNALVIDAEQLGASVREVEFCSAGLPTGEWLAVAKTPTRRVEQPLQVQVYASEYPSIHTRPAPGASVSRWAGCPQVEYSVGAHLIIVGDNLPPGQDLALGIYEVGGTLVNAMWVTPDGLGHFEAPLEIDSTYDSGYYFAVILLDEESDCTDLFDQSCVKGGFTVK
jgi:hypothetical protein